jgi:C-3',4' desaturase CrtD
MMKRILIIGAGFGGLATAAELSSEGFEVTVLEAHTYPGGSAGTFFHKGYRFDAGATLAGGFAEGGIMDDIARRFDIDWGAQPTLKAMQVHLPDNLQVTRWTDKDLWREERIDRFGLGGESFWDWQENTADALWAFAKRLPSWPPQAPGDVANLISTGNNWYQDISGPKRWSKILNLSRDAFRPVAAHVPQDLDEMRLFLDAQLLISAQTTSQSANALYGAAALDLARQGVAHIPGGMGTLAEKLVQVISSNGGQVHFRQQVLKVKEDKEGYFQVKTKRKDIFHADAIVFNLPPWNILSLLDGAVPSRLRRMSSRPRDGWGAFMAYLGLDAHGLNEDMALHHQVIRRSPLGEGNSIFMSLSPAWDESRAPAGKRALTISTHTALEPWWDLFEHDQAAYEDRKAEYLERLLAGARKVLPDIKERIELSLPGTPVTFQRFTRRAWGWVGGFPQTNLLRSWGPRLAPRMWIVGDAIFPGQSVPAVMLGGLRVSRGIIESTSSETKGALQAFKQPVKLSTQ